MEIICVVCTVIRFVRDMKCLYGQYRCRQLSASSGSVNGKAEGEGCVVVITSGKGGVGKTTTAASLAYGLAEVSLAPIIFSRRDGSERGAALGVVVVCCWLSVARGWGWGVVEGWREARAGAHVEGR